MKKLIAMIATVAVVLSMGVTAMADAIDKTKTESPEEEKIAAELAKDDYASTIYEKNVLTASQLADLDDKVEDGEKARVFSVNVYAEIRSKDEDGSFKWEYLDDKQIATKEGGSFDIAFTFDGANDVTDVYIWDPAILEWIDVVDWEVKDGKVIVTTISDGDFAFVITPAEEAADAEEAKKDDTKKSAATGYNSTAYIVCAIALAAGAAFFFGTSKKSAKEMM